MQMAKPAMQCGLDIELHTLNFVAHRPECTLDLYNVEKPSPKALWCNLSLQPLLCDVDIRRPGLKTRPVSLYGTAAQPDARRQLFMVYLADCDEEANFLASESTAIPPSVQSFWFEGIA